MLRILACSLMVSVATAQVTWFSVSLDGDQETLPVATTAGGWGICRLEEPANTVRLFAFHDALSGPATGAHMHQGAVGSNGPVIVGMTSVGATQWTATGTLTAGEVAALRAGDMYLNVHTGANPGGEIRGQVVLASSTRLTGLLDGAQQVTPVTSTGTGTVVAFLHQPENRVVYDVQSTGVSNVTAAHIHQGAAGANGPVIVPLNGGNGSYCGVSDKLSVAEVTALLAGDMYVNVHTTANPGGEIRAQLTVDAGDHWVADAGSGQENPPVASAGLGSGCLTIDAAGDVSFEGAFSGLTGNATASHIHVAPVGTNGPVVFGLTITGGPNEGTLSGTFSPSASELADLRAGNWYVNVHSSFAPGGEIRGQLVPARLPTTFGGGCAGSTGTVAQFGAAGFPCVGSSFDYDLYGGTPSTPFLLAVGLDRDTANSGTVVLPEQLTALGFDAPGCFALVEHGASLLVLSDADGCASFTLDIPFNPALRGTAAHAQWFGFDSAANPAGITTSNAISFEVQ